jgi:RHS repeat-associated protein
MHLTYNAINSQYAVKQSLPLGGDLEGFYAFNAKELDEENGMYYYSARYYAPPTFISRDPLFEKYPSISPYTYCANNPVNFIDPDGRIRRKAKNNSIYFQPIKKYGNMTTEMVIAGDGELSATMVRGTAGYVFANNGEKMKVLIVEEAYMADPVYGGDWKWRKVGSEWKCRMGTNCLGAVLLDNLYLPLDPEEVEDFLMGDGYKKVSVNNGYMVGDIMAFSNGRHYIRAIRKDKNGNLIWESRMAGDVRFEGTLKEIFDFNTDNYGAYNSTKNTIIYRPNQGDTYIDEDGNIISKDEKKKIWINPSCRDF